MYSGVIDIGLSTEERRRALGIASGAMERLFLQELPRYGEIAVRVMVRDGVVVNIEEEVLRQRRP